MHIKLSPRLSMLANLIPKNSNVVDIGGDHGWLLISLANQGKLSKGIIGEVSIGPYQNAINNVCKTGYHNLIEVRLGSGLNILKDGDKIDVLIISGMGGALICDILGSNASLLPDIPLLILQPNNAVAKVRRFLDAFKLRLVDEELVEDKKILYEILLSTPGESKQLYTSNLDKELLFEIGPILWRKQHKLLRKKLEEDLVKRRKVLQQVLRGSDRLKSEELTSQILSREEVLSCLF